MSLFKTPAAVSDAVKQPIVEDIEKYLKTATIDATVRTMVTQCLTQQPEQPNGLFIKYLMTQSPLLATSDVAVASSSTTDGPCYVAMSHEHAQTQQYILDTGLHFAMRELLQQVLQEKPDDILEFIAEAAKRMLANPPGELR